ncbi:MAG: hypothetical protein ACFCD0_12320 [Gemmataceae bacterium]
MKRILGLALVATMFALVPQQASAWSNIKFSTGVTMHWQTGNNAIGHHFWRSGQIPVPPHHHHHGFHHHGFHHHHNGFTYQPLNAPYYGPPRPAYPTSTEVYPQGFGGSVGYGQAPQYITFGQ